ncbi:MAG: acetylxylan esterase, partial [Terasakiella sp.]|nr:acetylxylan esterase [Terasakiella sp.]
ALAIMTAALSPRIEALVSYYPALSDMAGYTAGRAGGWPHIFADPERRTPAALATAAYYDTSVFARHVAAPGFYTFGFNDTTCPPTTTMAVYNTIAAPKTLLLAEDTSHYTYTEQTSAAWDWVMARLTSPQP